ncbi:Putative ribonuclease H protein At1g65750, partial [Linum grandiflorum]
SIPLRYSLRGGALEEWRQLLHFISSLPRDIITAGPATVGWSLCSNGVFSVQSLRRRLAEQQFPGTPSFPHDIVWFAPIPSKIQCFCWQVFLKKIATIDNFQRRGFHLENKCVLCGKAVETVDHIFIVCSFSYKVWCLIVSTLSIHGPNLFDVIGLISSWKGMNCTSQFRFATTAVLHSFFWYIWKERNNRIFRNSSPSTKYLSRKILLAVGNWMFVSGRFSDRILAEWNHLVFDNG